MARYNNVWSPMTPEGEGMQDAVNAFFLSGESPKQRADRDALARLRDEKINTERALQGRYRAERDRIKMQESGIQNFPAHWVDALPGIDQNDALGYFQSGAIPQIEAAGPPELSIHPEGQFGPQDESALEYPTMNKWNRDQINDLNVGRRLAAVLQASDRTKITPENISGASNDFVGQFVDRDLLNGQVDPNLFSVMRGKMPYDVKDGRHFSGATGEYSIDQPAMNESEALVGYRNAQRDERAATSLLRGEQKNTEVSKQGYYGDRGDAVSNKGGPKATKPPKVAFSANELNLREQVVNDAISQELGESVPVDPVYLSQIHDEAERIYRDPMSPHYQNMRGAIREAMSIVAPQGWEKTGDYGWWEIEAISDPEQNPRATPKGVSAGAEGSTGRPSTAIPRPGVPGAEPKPASIWYGPDKKRFTYDDILEEARDSGITPEDVIKQYRLAPGA